MVQLFIGGGSGNLVLYEYEDDNKILNKLPDQEEAGRRISHEAGSIFTP
jgi:hypothetical protein